jgi:uncharacterized membrane protein
METVGRLVMLRSILLALVAFLALGALAALAAAVWLGGRIAAAFCAWRREWRIYHEHRNPNIR